MFNSPESRRRAPWDDLRKILPGSQRMAQVLNGVEIFPKISISWVVCINVTDDRQTTGGRAITYSERKNVKTFVTTSMVF